MSSYLSAHNTVNKPCLPIQIAIRRMILKHEKIFIIMEKIALNAQC